MEVLEDHSKNLIIRVTEYGLKNERFTLFKLQTDLKLTKAQADFVENTLTQKNQHSTDSPNHILVASELHFVGQSPIPDLRRTQFSLLPNAFYNYVDYLEIKEARKQANEAKNQSNMALQVAVYSLLASVLLGLAGMFLGVMQIIINRF